MECDNFFVTDFIIIVLSKFRTKLLAANHLIKWDRTKFDTQKPPSKFLLEMMTLASSVYIVLIQNLFSGRGRLYMLWTVQSLEFILGEFHVSMYPIQRKKFQLNSNITSNFCLLWVKIGKHDYHSTPSYSWDWIPCDILIFQKFQYC